MARPLTHSDNILVEQDATESLSSASKVLYVGGHKWSMTFNAGTFSGIDTQNLSAEVSNANSLTGVAPAQGYSGDYGQNVDFPNTFVEYFTLDSITASDGSGFVFQSTSTPIRYLRLKGESVSALNDYAAGATLSGFFYSEYTGQALH